ncbi:hypothetical protein DPX16_10318 [Anabarilius grahami]|uniref:Uncharacterized protein n=1 Tax=Anabarilius grahami TaxID=495550 RepID=A0A3N0YD62_ANAGA|nr:hypothetical protein DPX16_10318 [Anabarilius grahami]
MALNHRKPAAEKARDAPQFCSTFPSANSPSNMNFMSSSGRKLRFFMFSLVSVLNIFIFFIGVCFFPQGHRLTHYNLWLQLLLEKTNEAFARLVQILRVDAEAAGRFSPHEHCLLWGMLCFLGRYLKNASEALELELGSARTVLLKENDGMLSAQCVSEGLCTESWRGWQEEFVLLSGSLKSSSSLDLKPGLMTRLIHWHLCAALSLSEPLHTPPAKHTRDLPASPREYESLTHAGVLKVSCAWDSVRC